MLPITWPHYQLPCSAIAVLAIFSSPAVQPLSLVCPWGFVVTSLQMQ